MILVLACAGHFAVMVLVVRFLLDRKQWQVWHPRLALAAWLVAGFSGLVALLCGVVRALQLLQWHGAGHAHGAGQVHGAGHAHGTGHEHGSAVQFLCTVACWGGLFLLSCLFALWVGQSEPVVRRERDHREHLRGLMDHVGQRLEKQGELAIRHVAEKTPLACSFRAPQPTVIVTQGLAERLSPAELQAVIEHERAHLAQRHNLVILIAVVAAACLPRFGPAVRFEQTCRMLVELIADDTAARRCGRDTVGAALATMADLHDSPGLQARADRMLHPRVPIR